MLVDTHCHIHEPSYALENGVVLERAFEAGVLKYVCVGTSIESSQQAIAYAESHEGSYATVGVHPHETKDGYDIAPLIGSRQVVAVGEIGLDYYYGHSPKETQIVALKAQIEIAITNDLPIIFHVRDAFDDFWPLIDSYQGKIRGIVHSFTDSQENLDQALARGLYIGVNGISTFTKDAAQQAMFDRIPLERMVLETDAPFLTPHPFRGKINEPAFVKIVAQYHAQRRGISLEEIAQQTSLNAEAILAL